ncbi:hypothetical protein [Salipiger bermudensis]|uniref:hypothetical protein n=1 Tax=Salipiger bermudensis TaxID=344736 RepID=UPI001CD45A8B|nr:hypothetical protein [Salipiger bermudensis]MCA0961139.1 hypothetical protein [Salipiger bermudensis]
MPLPNYVDPDKPMKVIRKPDGIPNAYRGSLPPENMALSAGLIIANQVLIGYLDQVVEDPDWRIQAYKEICEHALRHSHEGTGSEPEVQLHKAMEIISSLLSLRQVSD